MMKQIKIAMEDDLRAMLASEATKNGVSVASEVRERLWLSFGGSRGAVRASIKYEKAYSE